MKKEIVNNNFWYFVEYIAERNSLTYVTVRQNNKLGKSVLYEPLKYYSAINLHLYVTKFDDVIN